MSELILTARSYGITHRITKSTLEGITQEESLRPPTGGGNCINWIVGHILHTRDSLLESLGKSPVWNDDEAKKLYDRGSIPLTESMNATELSDLTEMFDISQPLLIEGIEHLNQHPTEDGKLEWSVVFLNFHESYHCGQLAILRRMLGKESIIK